MWKKIVAKAQELALQAEAIKGLSGPEKRTYVIKATSSAIDIPFVPEWMENIIEPILYGFIVDSIIKWWNALTDKNISQIELTPEIMAKTETAVLAEAKGKVDAKLPNSVPIADLKTGESGLTVDQKFDALLAKYAVK